MTATFINAVLDRMEQVLPKAGGPYPLHEPTIAGNAWSYVKECLDSGWVSSAGAYVERFERELAAFTGAPATVATVNGTAALHICLLLAGVRPGDEVLVPALTFVATANAVHYCSAQPHFVDVEETSLGVDAARLATHLDEVSEERDGKRINRHTGRPITTLIVMHCMGHVADLEALSAVAEHFRLTLVEDAAEALGSRHGDTHPGVHSGLGALSFNGNKTVTTGGGGAILLADPERAAHAKHLTTTARIGDSLGYEHDCVGYNYRMPNLNAALGCAQLEQLPTLLDAKRRLAQDYLAAFTGLEGVTILREPHDKRSNHWLNILILDAPHMRIHLPLLKALHDAGYLCRPFWTPMHQLPMNTKCPRMDLPVAESLYARGISLPSSAELRLS